MSHGFHRSSAATSATGRRRTRPWCPAGDPHRHEHGQQAVVGDADGVTQLGFGTGGPSRHRAECARLGGQREVPHRRTDRSVLQQRLHAEQHRAWHTFPVDIESKSTSASRARRDVLAAMGQQRGWK